MVMPLWATIKKKSSRIKANRSVDLCFLSKFKMINLNAVESVTGGLKQVLKIKRSVQFYFIIVDRKRLYQN